MNKQKLVFHSKNKIKIRSSYFFKSFKYAINAFLSVLRSGIVVNSNSWYIAMHLDRLNQELLEGYGKQVEDESQKKKRQPKSNTEMNKVDNHGI